jgi:hypothetical protein
VSLPASISLFRNRVISAVLLGSCLLAVAGESFAYDFTIHSRTEAYGYQLRRYDRNGLTFINRRRVSQYMGLRVFNLLDSGEDPASYRNAARPALLQLNALMRFFVDFGAYGNAADNNSELRDNQFELLLGALEGRNILGWIDFSLGRQYDAELMGFFAYDGLRLRINSPWHFFVESHFGIQVDRHRPFSPALFQADGPAEKTEGKSVAPSFGVAVGIADLYRLDLRVAYRGTASHAPLLDRQAMSDEVDFPQKVWGIDEEFLVVSGNYRVPWLNTQLSFAARLDLLLESMDGFQLNVDQRLGERHFVGFDFIQSRPHFDGDSIFNIFSIQPFTELSLRYQLRILAGLHAYSRFGYRRMWSYSEIGESLQLIEEDEDGKAFTFLLGTTLQWQRLHATLELYWFSGYGGLKIGGDFHAELRPLRWLSLEGRVSVIGFQDDQRSDAFVTTLGLQLGGKVRFAKGVLLHLLAENNVSQLYQGDLRFLAVLDVEVSP